MEPYLILSILFIIMIILYNNKNFSLKNYNLQNKYFNKKYSQIRREPLKDNKILVSIASYRDPQLIPTVESLYNNAKFPSLLHVVICEQNHYTDKFNIVKRPNMTVIRMSSDDARGPCWARYLIQQEWRGEEYYLQIDSHTRFVPGWDEKLRSCIKSLPPLSCLSNYVSTYNMETGQVIKSPLRGPMYVESVDTVDGFVRFNSKYKDEGTMTKPHKSNGWSGCFTFASSQIIIDAPYDPYTPFLFFGEEMDIYARLYTRGWSMYVPHIPICFTLFDRRYRKTFWEHPDCKAVGHMSRERIRERLNYANHGIYSLGDKRTLKSFMKILRS